MKTATPTLKAQTPTAAPMMMPRIAVLEEELDSFGQKTLLSTDLTAPYQSVEAQLKVHPEA